MTPRETVEPFVWVLGAIAVALAMGFYLGALWATRRRRRARWARRPEPNVSALNLFQQRPTVRDHIMIAGGVAGPGT